MNPPGVLHLTTFLQGGAGRAITDLACAQHAAGARVTVVTSETAEAGFGNYPEYLERLRAAGVGLRLCDSLFKRDLPLNLRVVEALYRHVRFDDVDVVHAHAAMPALIGRLFAARAPLRLPVLQTQHGWGINKTSGQAATDLAVLRTVDRVVTSSEATRDLLVSFGVPEAQCMVIPCGIEPHAGSTAAAAYEILGPARARGARVIGCIGSVTPNKNQRLVVEALPLLRDANAVAVFIGEGGEALAAQAAALGVGDRVITCGYQPDAARWLPLMDLLALPSRTEGQGLVVLEAFRAGVPVVASDIPPLAHLVRDGRSGFLFEPDDAGALAAAIRRALALPPAERELLAGAARRTFEAEYTLDRMVARHAALYEELIEEALS